MGPDAVAKFDSFKDADEADKAYYLALTPEQRLQIMCDLCAAEQELPDGTTPRLARVYRIVELPRR